jgi:hypothetical protein
MVAGFPRIAAGYRIRCAHCRKEFESRGLKCCSVECERRYREAHDNRAVMAEVGIEPSAKRRCEACGGIIPKWRNGRHVSKVVRFCSDRCSSSACRDPCGGRLATAVPTVTRPLAIAGAYPGRERAQPRGKVFETGSRFYTLLMRVA